MLGRSALSPSTRPRCDVPTQYGSRIQATDNSAAHHYIHLLVCRSYSCTRTKTTTTTTTTTKTKTKTKTKTITKTKQNKNEDKNKNKNKNNNNNPIWRGSVFPGEDLQLHSGELHQALFPVGGPTQSQQSRPTSSRHHISMEHWLRKIHLLLNSDTSTAIIYI